MATVISEPDHRVGPVPAEGDAACTEEHCQRGEPVGAGVQPVRNQCGRADLAAHADAVPGDDLVAGEADQRGDRDRDQVRHRARVELAG